MKSPFTGLLLLLLLAAPAGAFATGPNDDGTDGGRTADAMTSDDGTSDETPLGCDGALCSTATGATACSVMGGVGATQASSPTAVLFLAAAGLRTRRRHLRRAKERIR